MKLLQELYENEPKDYRNSLSHKLHVQTCYSTQLSYGRFYGSYAMRYDSVRLHKKLDNSKVITRQDGFIWNAIRNKRRHWFNPLKLQYSNIR